MSAALEGSKHPERCRLCHQIRPLQKSHFLPAAMYKYLNPGDNRHVIVNRRTYFSTSYQVMARLLCRDCEQRFNRNGEKWVIENGFRGPGKPFKIQSVLKAATPLGRTRTGAFFAGNTVCGIDMDRLVYFGASVFWRSSIHQWPNGDGIDLGPVYKDQFRKFLLGESPFPSNAVVVIHIADTEKPMEAAYTPNGGRVTGAAYHQYGFMLPGMLFTLAVGGGIPSQLKLMCAVHSPQRLILLSSRVQDLVMSIATDMVVENEAVRREVLEGLPPMKV